MATELPVVAQALLNPAAYPGRPAKVEMMQTQMSFVFFSDELVYKIKKPVNLGYLDYTTLEKRHFFCQQEVILNRRLCQGVYLGVVRITRSQEGILVDGNGEIIDYAVKMNCLPQDRMLNSLLERNQVSPEMIQQVAGKLVDFHTAADTNPTISSFGNIKYIRLNWEENFAQTEKYCRMAVIPGQWRRISEFIRQTLREKATVFNQRVATGHIRDCHGDLHAAHICFTDDICIFDCIEFNDRFRFLDIIADIAFLAMDLDHFGRADLARTFIRTYCDLSRDNQITELLKFYKCYRAYVRGKVESFQYDDPYIELEGKKRALEAAKSYFELASSYSRLRPVLFITAGLTGSGKTTIARALAKRLGLTVISSDIVRKKLASIPATEHRFEEMEAGIYTPEFSRRTYDMLFSEARLILNQGDSVILDATFIKAEERHQARKLAEEVGADFCILECVLDADNTRKRLTQRLKDGTISDGRWEIYLLQKERFEPITEVPEKCHCVIDTGKALEEQITRIAEKV